MAKNRNRNQNPKIEPRKKVFFEIEINGEVHPRKIVMELFNDIVPKTAENFRALCIGENGNYLHYRRSYFHRVIRGFILHGGDITNSDGTGGVSIKGRYLKDENFQKNHDDSFLLSMANTGKKYTNTLQFFITMKAAPWLNRKHVVLGKVVDGFPVLSAINNAGSPYGTVDDGPVRISDCGEYLD